MQVSYESWLTACNMMKYQKRRLFCYLQWYPFSRLSNSDWLVLESSDFWKDYIADGAFILDNSMRFVTHGYIQKQGIALRDSYLVSPHIFLYLLAYGIEFAKCYDKQVRQRKVFYSGNLSRCSPFYRDEYLRFCRSVGRAVSQYSHCIVSDISNYFPSINVDQLLEDMAEYSDHSYSAIDGLFLKALLLYCGHGRYPIIENHPAISYFATQIFLFDIDRDIIEYASGLTGVSRVKLIRYVDDSYFFIDIDSNADSETLLHLIAEHYRDLLYAKCLSINPEKTERGSSYIASGRLTVLANNYVDILDDESHLFISSNSLVSFFSQVEGLIAAHKMNSATFEESVCRCFSQVDSSIPPMVAFRICIYRYPELFKDPVVTAAIARLSKLGNRAFEYHTREIVHCFLNTENGDIIKGFLNTLFISSKNDTWSGLDSLAAITYLILRGVQHRDLIETIRRRNPSLAKYISLFCTSTMPLGSNDANTLKLLDILDSDATSKIQYLYSLSNSLVNNHLEQFGYYKSFFDRFTSFAKYCKKGRKGKIHWCKSDNDFIKFYRDIKDSKKIIKKSCRMREKNPLIHASSELIKDKYFDATIKECIGDLESLLNSYLSQL